MGMIVKKKKQAEFKISGKIEPKANGKPNNNSSKLKSELNGVNKLTITSNSSKSDFKSDTDKNNDLLTNQPDTTLSDNSSDIDSSTNNTATSSNTDLNANAKENDDNLIDDPDHPDSDYKIVKNPAPDDRKLMSFTNADFHPDTKNIESEFKNSKNSSNPAKDNELPASEIKSDKNNDIVEEQHTILLHEVADQTEQFDHTKSVSDIKSDKKSSKQDNSASSKSEINSVAKDKTKTIDTNKSNSDFNSDKKDNDKQSIQSTFTSDIKLDEKNNKKINTASTVSDLKSVRRKGIKDSKQAKNTASVFNNSNNEQKLHDAFKQARQLILKAEAEKKLKDRLAKKYESELKSDKRNIKQVDKQTISSDIKSVKNKDNNKIDNISSSDIKSGFSLETNNKKNAKISREQHTTTDTNDNVENKQAKPDKTDLKAEKDNEQKNDKQDSLADLNSALKDVPVQKETGIDAELKKVERRKRSNYYAIARIELPNGKRDWYYLSYKLQLALGLAKEHGKNSYEELANRYINIPVSDYNIRGNAKMAVGRIIKIKYAYKKQPKHGTWKFTRSQFIDKSRLSDFKSAYKYMRHDYTMMNRIRIGLDLLKWKHKNKKILDEKLKKFY